MTAAALTEVRLYGALGARFGRRHRLAVASAREALHALGVVVPGFAAAVLAHEPGVHVFVGQRRPANSIGAAQLDAPVSHREPICVVPAVVGAKQQGLLQVIIGAAIWYFAPYLAGAVSGQTGAYAAAISTYGSQIGMAMALGGVVQMLGARSVNTQPRPENQPSYYFDGPVNTTQQGLPVALRYGRVVCGGAVISSGIATERLLLAAPPVPMPPQDLPADQQGPTPGDPGGGGGGDW
ncbi:MAG: tail assembly protein [Ideonella sp.]|nr:tail assembly protein [Ideonella sp.]MCC7455997.1 tail assembly protein [Nitrospira sp.]